MLRLEEAFGIIPAIVLGSASYAAYHIGYGMPTGEMVFLFFITKRNTINHKTWLDQRSQA